MAKTKKRPSEFPTTENLNQCWQTALKFWSAFPRAFPAPQLHTDPQQLLALNLSHDLARVHLRSGSVLLNGLRLKEAGLLTNLPLILAHEAGHLLYSPASILVQRKSLEILQSHLPNAIPELPHLANLWQDLLINQRLYPVHQTDLISLIKALCPSQPPPLWQWVLRGYEYLWYLTPGSLIPISNDPCLEADASDLADLVHAFQNNDLGGLAGFAQLCKTYLDQESRPFRMREGTAWPSQQPRPAQFKAGEDKETSPSNAETENPWSLELPKPVSISQHAQTAQNLHENPQHWQKFWSELGIDISTRASTLIFYREKALPLLAPWKIPMSGPPTDQLPEGLKPWLLDAPVQEIAWVESLLNSPRVVPGLTTVKQRWSHEPEQVPSAVKRLDLYLDASGSLPDPFLEKAWMVLTGFVLALSALHQGWSVRVTLWSGTNEPIQTQPFSRNESTILTALTHYLGGSTRFPLELFKERYPEHNSLFKPEASYICLLSDQGLLDSLHAEQGLEIFKKTLKHSHGGGSLFLQWPAEAPAHMLFAPLQAQGWSIHPVHTEEDIRSATQALFRQKKHA
jgi:hypothetical protein